MRRSTLYSSIRAKIHRQPSKWFPEPRRARRKHWRIDVSSKKSAPQGAIGETTPIGFFDYVDIAGPLSRMRREALNTRRPRTRRRTPMFKQVLILTLVLLARSAVAAEIQPTGSAFGIEAIKG